MCIRDRVKLADQHRGIKDMRRVPNVVIIVDANFESTAVQEALKLEIPVITIVDTNTDPTVVSHAIPANDDSIRTIQLIISALTDTILSAQVKDAEKPEDGGEPEINPKAAVITDDTEKEVKSKADTTDVAQEVGDESEVLEEEIAAQKNTEDSDKNLPDKITVDELQDDMEEPEIENNSNSN